MKTWLSVAGGTLATFPLFTVISGASCIGACGFAAAVPLGGFFGLSAGLFHQQFAEWKPFFIVLSSLFFIQGFYYLYFHKRKKAGQEGHCRKRPAFMVQLVFWGLLIMTVMLYTVPFANADEGAAASSCEITGETVQASCEGDR